MTYPVLVYGVFLSQVISTKPTVKQFMGLATLSYIICLLRWCTMSSSFKNSLPHRSQKNPVSSIIVGVCCEHMLSQCQFLGKKRVALATLNIFNAKTRNLLYCVRIRFFCILMLFFLAFFSLHFLLVLNYITTLVTLQTFSIFFVIMLYKTHLSYTLISTLCTLFQIFHYYLLECVMV